MPALRVQIPQVERAQRHSQFTMETPSESDINTRVSQIDNMIQEARDQASLSSQVGSLLQVNDAVDAVSDAQFSLLGGAKEAEVTPNFNTEEKSLDDEFDHWKNYLQLRRSNA